MLDDDQVGEGSKGREERVNEQSGDPISSGRMGETSLMMMGPQMDGGGEEVTFGQEQSRCTRE